MESQRLRPIPIPVLFVLVAAATLASAGCALAPGRHLEGTPGEPPPTWEMLGFGAPCELEVSAPSPRSVELECYEFEGQLYVHADRSGWTTRWWSAAWAEAASRDPDVRLGVYGELFALRAQLVTDTSLRQRVLGSRGMDPARDGIQLFALLPRPGR
jgi:hypothetical protein